MNEIKTIGTLGDNLYDGYLFDLRNTQNLGLHIAPVLREMESETTDDSVTCFNESISVGLIFEIMCKKTKSLYDVEVVENNRTHLIVKCHTSHKKVIFARLCQNFDMSEVEIKNWGV